ncbi:MAG: DNA primase [Cellvibrionaceae bacterium]|jgi:DNA primase
MVGMIPRNFVDDLLDRTDIVEIIDHRVKLKKSGKNYTACCPFHDEKTPSFSVSPDKQFYYCFGCGAKGNAIGFLVEYERASFPEAVESLAKTLGIEVPRENDAGSAKQRDREKARKEARQQLYELLQEVSDYYQRQLREHKEKQHAVDYLKRRGLTGQIAKVYGIGFAPPGWNNIASEFPSSNEQQDQLLEVGMLVRKEDQKTSYDRFRDRIMFPIRNLRGQVIAFGGRVLSNQKPKYLNSPETPLFSKSKELYGLHEALQAAPQLPRLLVVEGYMDVVSLAQFGIQYGVATLGTACNPEHLKQALRFTNEIVFCFDGDEAGRKAARRAMESALSVMEDGRQIKFLYLPKDEDPDTLVRQVGAEKFTFLIEGATPLESFLFEELGRGFDVQSIEGRARLCKLAAPLLNQLPRGVYRELMFQQLSKRSQLSMDVIITLLEELPQPPPTEKIQSDTNPGGAPPQNSAEDRKSRESFDTRLSKARLSETRLGETRLSSDRRSSATLSSRGASRQPAADELALALLLFEPKLAQSFQNLESLRHHNNDRVTLLVKIMELLHRRPEYTSGEILGYWQGTYGTQESEYLQQLLNKGVLFQRIKALNSKSIEHSFDAEKEFLDALTHLQKHQASQNFQSVIQQLNAKPFESWTDADRKIYSQAIDAIRK